MLIGGMDACVWRAWGEKNLRSVGVPAAILPCLEACWLLGRVANAGLRPRHGQTMAAQLGIDIIIIPARWLDRVNSGMPQPHLIPGPFTTGKASARAVHDPDAARSGCRTDQRHLGSPQSLTRSNPFRIISRLDSSELLHVCRDVKDGVFTVTK